MHVAESDLIPREKPASSRGLVGIWLPALSMLVVAAGLLAFAILPGQPALPVPSVELHALGQRLALDANIQGQAQSLTRMYLRAPMILAVGALEFTASRAAMGIGVDVASLERLLEEARDPRSPLRRFHAQRLGDAPLDLRIPAQLDTERGLAWVQGIADQVRTEPVPAKLNTKSLRPLPEQPGLVLEVQRTLDSIEQALLTGQTRVTAQLVRTPAPRSQQELVGQDFGQILGSFESRYNPADQDRAFNLRVAAGHVDGIVLMPGEVFDFNAVVGERSMMNGFRPAPVIADGELADGVGGGTCQIAGTLYSAVYFAGLNIITRSTHTRPSSYLRLGLDATVSYPKLNFRFQNDLNQAVAIAMRVEGGKVKALVRGARPEREISFIRRIDQTKRYTEEKRDDGSLPNGARVLSQRGVPGFEVTSFRLIRDLTTGRIVRERRHEVYPPTQQIWRIGRGSPLPPGEKLPPHDQHGEYTADEYLHLTYHPDTQRLEEVKRVEGRSGTPGWTSREGMPQAAL
jgi:vancomycin resistance protein YoaR